MQLSPRLKPWRIEQLYQRTRIGILDEDKLMHIGWGLYARGEAVLAMGRAKRGEVPCPECKKTVYRQIYYRNKSTTAATAPDFVCPTCAEKLTWHDCRNALRDHPRCFDCNIALEWSYSNSLLSCPQCSLKWTWQKYRQSIVHRVRLPCPHCNNTIRKPETKKATAPQKRQASSHWDLTCPNCKKQGQHTAGNFHCTHCGYEKKWRVFTKRQKRRTEYLNCEACGHTFTWQSWQKQYDNAFAHTGNPAPIRRFVELWPKCKSPGEQIITIDRLIHALHGRGALAPVFIQGSQSSIAQWLDDLAFK